VEAEEYALHILCKVQKYFSNHLYREDINVICDHILKDYIIYISIFLKMQNNFACIYVLILSFIINTSCLSCYMGTDSKLQIISCNQTVGNVCFSFIYNNTRIYDCYDGEICKNMTIIHKQNPLVKDIVCCTKDLCNSSKTKSIEMSILFIIFFLYLIF
jgi:hypothetical protein